MLINNPKKVIYTNSIKIFSCLLVAASLLALLFQNHVSTFGYHGFGGLFLSDSLGMKSNLLLFVENSDGNFTGIYGVMLLYYPSYYLGGTYSLVLNINLLILAVHFFLKTLIQLDVRVSPRKIILICVIVISNFYILQVLCYPNKEIPLILLTNAFLYYFITVRKFAVVFLILLMTLFIRDGHGLVLILTLISITFFRDFLIRKPYKFLVSIFILFSTLSLEVIGSFGILGDYNYIIDRNVNLVSDNNLVLSDSILNIVPVYIAYPLKVINHLVSNAIRPQFIDLNDRIYVTGIGLWQNGVIILLGISSWLYLIRQKKNDKVLTVGVIVISGLLFISVGVYTQPRYMMPYIFWLTAGFVYLLDIRKILIGTLGIFLFSIFLTLLNYGVPIPIGNDIDPFQF